MLSWERSLSIRKKDSYDIRLTISSPSNNRIIMSCTIGKEAFQRLINRDLEWLMEQPRSPERDHIEYVIKQTLDLNYERLESNKRLFDEWSARSCEWLRQNLRNYLGVFTEHYVNDEEGEVVKVRPCINAEIYEDLPKAVKGET